MTQVTKEDIVKGVAKQTVKALVNGGTGTGKTYFCMTAPKWAYAEIEPNGLDTARSNPKLLENMVYADSFIPSPDENIKSVMERLNKFMTQAHADAKAGKIETLIVDNVSYLSENFWMFINQFEPIKAANGALDTRSMYGTLGRKLYDFTLTKVLSFPGNVFMTCHEMREDEEEMTRRVDPTTPIVPNILGGFRTKVGGMFSASIYLDKKKVAVDQKDPAKGSKYIYLARCQKGDKRDAKNRYNLPEIIEDVDYNKVLEAIRAGKK